MAEIKARIILDDNFSTKIDRPIDSAERLTEALTKTKSAVDDITNKDINIDNTSIIDAINKTDNLQDALKKTVQTTIEMNNTKPVINNDSIIGTTGVAEDLEAILKKTVNTANTMQDTKLDINKTGLTEAQSVVERFESTLKNSTAKVKEFNDTKPMFQSDDALNRALKLQFAIAAIKKNVSVMVEAKGNAAESINKIKNSATSLVRKPVDLVLKATDRVTSTIRSITDSIFSLKTLAAGIILGGAGKKTFDWTIGNATENEKYLATLQTVLKSKQAGSDALKWSYQAAQSTPFDAKEVVAGVTQLATSQLDFTKYLMPLGDAAAAMNKPLEQAIFAMGKLKSGQYGMAVDMFRDFGISNQDWTKAGAQFSKNGEMQVSDPQKAVDMVTAIMKSKYGGLMDQMSNTAGGRESNIIDSINAMGRGLSGIDPNGAIIKGGLFDNFKKQLENIQPLLTKVQNSKAFAALQQQIGQLATEGGNKLTAFLKSFDNPKKIEEYKNKFHEFVNDLKNGVTTAMDIGKAFASIGVTLQPIIQTVAEHPKLFLGLFAGFEAGRGAISIIGTFRDIKKELPDLITAVKNFGTGFINIFKSVGAFLVANPVVLAITGIITVVALLYEAWTNDWGGIREKTEKVIQLIKEKFDNFKKAIVELKDNAIKKVKEEFDNLKDALIDLKDKAVHKVNEKFDACKKTLKDNQTEIKVTAGILGTIFGPALIKTGIEAAIAGGKIAASFTLNMVRAGTAAVVNGAKVTANFIVSMIKTGAEAIINGGKLTANFIASMAKAGVAATVNGAKITASFVASIIKAGAEAVISGAKITGSFIASLARAAVQATITAATITGQLIMAVAKYAIEGWKAVISIGAQTVALGANTIALGAQKIALMASTLATTIATKAQWLFNAALSANPIGIVILALGALGLAIYEVVKHWQDICEWIEKAWNWLTKWNSTPADNKSATVSYVDAKVGPIGKNALGTSYWKGGLTWVGEHGPELLDIPSGSKVYNNNESNGMLGRNITIPKLADTIIVREDTDIDRIATAITQKLLQHEANMA